MITINKNPSTKDLRWFAGLWFPLFCGLIGYFALNLGDTVAYAIWGVGIGLGLIGVFVPSIIRPVFIGLMYLTFPIGFVVSTLVLAVIFFFLFTPIGFVLKVVRKNGPIARHIDRDASTYWQSIPEESNVNRYFQQY